MRTAIMMGLVCLGLTGGPLRAATEAEIQQAIQAGTKFLRASSQPGAVPNAGLTPDYQGFGAKLLVGLALLEGGVPPSDSLIQQLLKDCRSQWPQELQTYTVSLMILFLDRIGDVKDEPILQLLGVRLYGGMTADLGWTYTNPDLVPMIGVDQIHDLVTIPDRPVAGTPMPPAAPGFPKSPTPPSGRTSPFPPALAKANLPKGIASYFAAVLEVQKSRGRQANNADNSNTVFGMIALWAASRYGLPVEDAFAGLELRYLRMQNRQDGGWSYTSTTEPSSPAMTCAGLLGLAVGAARQTPQGNNAKAQTPQDPFEVAPRSAANPSLPTVTPERRQASITAGLRYLGRVIRETQASGNWKPFVGHGDEYYMLWSIERMAMAYGLKTIADQPWYEWGCRFLLQQQQPDGHFRPGSYGAHVSTAFAILFLKRSNFVSDLTKRLGGGKDPGLGELRASQGFQKPAAPNVRPEMPAEPGSRPATTSRTPEEIADELLKSLDFAGTLETITAAKGGEYTAGMLLALPRCNPEQKLALRDALTRRLTRMTSKTLSAMLKDSQPELRRAAALAVGQKDDRERLGDLIDRIQDSVPEVVTAAQTSLKQLSQQDFGPQDPTSPAQRQQAFTAWTRWYLSQPASRPPAASQP